MDDSKRRFKWPHKVCPECGRGNALSKPEGYGEEGARVFVWVCRFCKGEKVTGNKQAVLEWKREG